MTESSNPAVSVVYFSPTGTTHTILKTLVPNLTGKKLTTSEDLEIYDLTNPLLRDEILASSPKTVNLNGEFAIFAVPVYEDIIPHFLVPVLKRFLGRGQPTILIATYGNILAGKTLYQLKTLVEKRGFLVMAAGEFVAEHSFSHPNLEVASGRPNAADLTIVQGFEP